MIVTDHNSKKCQTGWQSDFVAMLPELQSRLRHSFRELDPEARDDSTEDGIIHCLLSYIRLFEQGRVDAASPASLVRYAALQTRKGRHAGCPLNVREPLSRYAQLSKGFKVKRLQIFNRSEEGWIDAIVEDKRASVGDIVAARLDIRAWLATLCRRSRNIAADLAKGCSTSEVARKYRVSAGRISQLRRELENSWKEFQHESELALAS